MFRTVAFANGVTVEFFDESNRYFGDYHRVCVEVRIHGPAGGDSRINRLERMGVPGAEVGSVRDRLVEDFLAHAGRYLAQDDFPSRLVVAGKPGGRSRPDADGH